MSDKNGIYEITEIREDGRFVLTRASEKTSYENDKVLLTSITIDGDEIVKDKKVTFNSIEDFNDYCNHYILKKLHIPCSDECGICAAEITYASKEEAKEAAKKTIEQYGDVLRNLADK